MLLSKARQAARHRLVSLPTHTHPHHNPRRRSKELETAPATSKVCGTPRAPFATPPSFQHSSDRSRQEVRGQRLFPSCILRRMEGNGKYFLGLYLGPGLGILSIDGCSSSRPRFKFSIGNAANNYEKFSQCGIHRIVCVKQILSLLFYT